MAPKMEEIEDLKPPHLINPYEVLGIETAAAAAQVKSAYRKLALKHHPDKADVEDKTTAHTKFQEIAFAYAILSDPRRRLRYDTTGNTAESLDDDDFNWTDFFRAQKKDVVTPEAVDKIKAEYQGSDEEKDDILAAYKSSKGNMDAVYDSVMCSNVLDDDDRFRGVIDQAIAEERVPGWKKYTAESEKKKKARRSRAEKEAREAEGYAEELENKVPSSLTSLAALIQGKDTFGGGFLDRMEAKYGTKKAADKPPEEAFARNRANKPAKKDRKRPAEADEELVTQNPKKQSKRGVAQ